MTDSHISIDTEEAPEQLMASRGELRSRRPNSDAFREFMGSGWGPRITKEVERCGAADYLPQYAAKTGEPFAGERLVISAGIYKVRNSDCTYRLHVYSAFAHLSGLGGEREPDSVLILEPKENGSHEVVLYFKPRTSRSAQEFYSDSQYGEFWVGARPSLEEVRQEVGLRCAHIDTLPDTLAKDVGRAKLRVVRGVDASIEVMVNKIREQAGLPFGEGVRSADEVLEEHLSEIRLHKDILELAELARVVEVTRAGFEDIVRVLPRAVGHRRGERVVEGVFGTVIREEGNGLGHDTIAASGNHTNTFHWIDSDGSTNEGDLIPVDTGVEADSLYTADITRTLPINGRFIEAQARVYQVVLNTYEMVLAWANEPGIHFRGVHDAAMFVIAIRPREWGLLSVGVEEPLSPVGQQHRRWTSYGTGRHLGLDVHDCAQTRHETYQDAPLEPGITFTIEPGLYSRVDDEAIPAEYRDIGTRIEDDVVVNEGGSVTRISEDTPRMIDDVEAWAVRVQGC